MAAPIITVRERLASLVRKKIIKRSEVIQLLSLLRDPWEETRGLLKGRGIDALKYQRAMRAEWNR